MRKISLILMLYIFGTSISIGQTLTPEVISSSGGTFEKDNISLNWTIGECFTETYSSSDNILTQGFHQGKYLITTINELADLNYKIQVFPNPSPDRINIIFKTKEDLHNVKLELCDLKGSILLSKDVFSKQEQINLANLQKSIYILRIIQNNQISKSFKIQKIN